MSSEDQTEQGSKQPGVSVSTATRRRFNQGAATGAAVLLTLGNQVAWGDGGKMCVKVKTKTKGKCISAQVWNSLGGSYHKAGKKHDDQRAAFNNFLNQNDLSRNDVFEVGSPPQACATVEVQVERKKKCKKK